MKKWLVPIVAAMMFVGSLVLVSCSTGHGKYAEVAQSRRGEAPDNFVEVIDGRRDLNGEGGTTFDGVSHYRSAPDFDLDAAIGAGRGGGGQSPFLSSTFVGGSVKFNGEEAPADGGLLPRSAQFPDDEMDVRRGIAMPEVDRDSRYTTRSTEELWVIQRPARHINRDTDDEPGSGCLMAQLPGEQRTVPIPLKHTDVKASISGFIQSVDVTQTFTNPYSSKIEAVYVFPLPELAAVSEFVMTIGDRHIRGIIREKEQAERIYYAARAAGQVASLLTQERPNIFTQRVANIEPGRSIDVSIRYFGTLAYSDGAFEFVFPMVVGPRYNPSSSLGNADGVGAVARGKAGASGQEVEVQYLRPHERSAHDISLAVDIDAGVSIERVESPSHVVHTRRDGPSRMRVQLAPNDTIPNKDFVLRCVVAGGEAKSAIITHDVPGDRHEGYFTLMLIPPASAMNRPRNAVEMVFVLDCSGSMEGKPIAQAKAAIERGLDRLEPGDTFQIIDFAQNASQLGREPILATPSNVWKAKQFLGQLGAGGGTEMLTGLRASLDFPHDEERLRFVAFLTDGFIGNEADILRETHDRLGESRIFSFGVGSAPNRALMDSMAKMGRGCVAYVGLQEAAEEVMDAFMDRVSVAAMTGVRLDFGDADVRDVYPARTPDLFVGRPVYVTGRYRGAAPTEVSISGRQGGKKVKMVAHAGATNTPEALPKVWARMKLAGLAESATWNTNPTIAQEKRRTALDYGLMSEHTAFVAVDSMSRTAGAAGTTVGVPVPVPEGVSYDTTVQEGHTPRELVRRRRD